ncbi:MAG: phosphotransferase [Methyloversatilis sp.]|uniref:phosphotransferase enzyme family protein n=1 Tax=Methyloversatilis sp. TaxID=2569862 RepID=UPI002735EDC1|nr:phosphotransferase [Methyloversatilis sp.]MDP3871363.1 phosphotransferase [Methyloversatilis sp.]
MYGERLIDSNLKERHMASFPCGSEGKPSKSAGSFREPIASTFTPKSLCWAPAGGNLLPVLVDAFGKRGDYLVASGTGATEISYCRMTVADANVDLFIKLVPRRIAVGLQRSGGISDYVRECGVLTPVCEPGFPKACLDGRVAFAYPFVDGTYLNNSLVGLPKLGGELARLHAALGNFPASRKVAHLQRRMRIRMRRKAADLLADESWACCELSPVRAHVRRWLAIDAGLGNGGCQVIHNDLNAGNVLEDTNGNVWFLDFEEAGWSYLPAHFDIARIIERFILVDEAWDSQTKTLAAERLLDAYSRVGGVNRETAGRIPLALGWLLGFSWLRMSRFLCDREAFRHAEVRKFLRLAEVHDANRIWLAAL